MVLLSGDHATSASAALVCVICRGAVLPSTGTSQRSELCSFSSYDGSVTEETTHLPSGLGTGAPTRFISQSASCVGAFLAGMADVGWREAGAGRVAAEAGGAGGWAWMGGTGRVGIMEECGLL